MAPASVGAFLRLGSGQVAGEGEDGREEENGGDKPGVEAGPAFIADGEGDVGEQEREEKDQEGVLVEGFGEVSVQEGGEGSGGAATRAEEACVLMDGAEGVEGVAVGREAVQDGRGEGQEGCGDDGAFGF
jgi:hypothetical protein